MAARKRRIPKLGDGWGVKGSTSRLEIFFDRTGLLGWPLRNHVWPIGLLRVWRYSQSRIHLTAHRVASRKRFRPMVLLDSSGVGHPLISFHTKANFATLGHPNLPQTPHGSKHWLLRYVLSELRRKTFPESFFLCSQLSLTRRSLFGIAYSAHNRYRSLILAWRLYWKLEL